LVIGGCGRVTRLPSSGRTVFERTRELVGGDYDSGR
jgi:hypothetical protein